jgi:hypothetical protein
MRQNQAVRSNSRLIFGRQGAPSALLGQIGQHRIAYGQKINVQRAGTPAGDALATKAGLNLVQGLQSLIRRNRTWHSHQRCGVHIIGARANRKARRPIQRTHPQRATEFKRDLARGFGHKLIWRPPLERLIGPQRDQELGFRTIHR